MNLLATRSHASPSDDTLLLAANPARRGVLIENNSAAALLIGFGPAPTSAARYDLVTAPHEVFDTVGDEDDDRGWSPLALYTGEVRGIWAGTPHPGDLVRITELTEETP